MTPGKPLRDWKILSVPRRSAAPESSLNLGLARGHRADVVRHASAIPRKLKDRGLAVLEAVCAKIMRGFARAHFFLRSEHKRPVSRGYQLVALLLSVPVFHCSNLAFKFLYALNHRRLRLMCLEQGLVGIEDDLIKLDSLPLNLSHRMKAHEALTKISQSLQARNGGDKLSVHD